MRDCRGRKSKHGPTPIDDDYSTQTRLARCTHALITGGDDEALDDPTVWDICRHVPSPISLAVGVEIGQGHDIDRFLAQHTMLVLGTVSGDLM